MGKISLVFLLLMVIVSGCTTIHTAVLSGNLPKVKSMLEKDPALVNEREGRYGEFPLHQAAYIGSTDMVLFLLSKGADVNAKNKIGSTALMYAALKGNTETVKVLLEQGANVNAKNNGDFTALMSAALGYTPPAPVVYSRPSYYNPPPYTYTPPPPIPPLYSPPLPPPPPRGLPGY